MKSKNQTVRNSMLSLFFYASLVCIGTLEASSQELITKSLFEKQFELTAKLIVMLKVDYREGAPEIGAGFIFGHDNDHLFIATAYHVVHRGSEPLNIWVGLKTMPVDKLIKANLLKNGKEVNLDLAVISIGDLTKQGINPCAFPYDRLRMMDDLKRDDTVFSVGNPHGDSWAEPIEPDLVSQINGKEIVFQSASISRGNSGGPLIDVRADLVGMTTADAPPFGRAINIDYILQHVKKWGYPVQLNSYTEPDLGIPLLHDAAMNGDIVALKNLLAQCNNPDEVDMHYITALHLAAYWGKTEAITVLLKDGADIEAQDALGDTPLEHAVDNFHNLETVKLLIKAGAKINNKDYQGLTALHKALLTDTIEDEVVLFLIHSGADVNLQDLENNKALHYAVINEKAGIVKELIKTGANTEIQGKDKRTPLLLAIENQKEEMVRLLLSSGANVNGPGLISGLGALHMAAYDPGNIEIIKILLTAGAKVNAKDEDGNSPLHIVIRSGQNYKPPSVNQQLEAITLLLKAGADVNAKNVNGHTPLAAARIIYTDPSYNNSDNKEENMNRFNAIEKLLRQHGGK
jgi:ankyrin repeat protein